MLREFTTTVFSRWTRHMSHADLSDRIITTIIIISIIIINFYCSRYCIKKLILWFDKKGFISLVYKNSWQKRNNKDINLQVRLFHFRLEWYRERELLRDDPLLFYYLRCYIWKFTVFTYVSFFSIFSLLGSMICLGESEYYKYNNPDEETLNEEAKKAKCQARMMMMTTTTSSLRSASNLAAANNKNLVKRSSSTSTSQKHDYVSNGITRIAVFLLF